jgi:chemotaxis response regulator CheB
MNTSRRFGWSNIERFSAEQGSAGVVLSPGHAWIAPGNFHMMVRADLLWSLGLNQEPPQHSLSSGG